MSKLKNEKELVNRASGGDKEAFRVLFEEYYSRAYNLAFGIMKNHSDAEEVLQEAFVKAYFALPKFKGDSSFYTWLYRIVRNMAIDVKRKLSKRVQAGPHELDEKRIDEEQGALNSTAARPDQAYENKQALSFVSKALKTLKDEHREILIMREIDGLSYEEIARITSLNNGTVMSRLFYARKALKDALAKLEGLSGEGVSMSDKILAKT